MVIENIQSIMQRRPETKNYPKHVIINLFPVNEKLLKLVTDLIDVQLENNLPILTISLGKVDNLEEQKLLKGYTVELLKKAIDKKIKITILGQWYDLYGELVEALKKVNNETMHFDHFFLNICINYDGKREIADACRVIIRKVMQDKTDIDAIDPEIIKENIYSSNFMPPDLIIEPNNKFTGTFLWDSADSKILLLHKKVLDVSKADFVKAIEWYAANN